MNNRTIHIALAMTLTLVSLGSCCTCDEWCYSDNEAELRLRYEWHEVDSIPKSMSVAFYPESGTAVGVLQQGYRLYDTYSDSARVKLPEGMYKAVAWNNDAEHSYVKDIDNLASASLCSETYPFTENHSVRLLLDSIYGGHPIVYSADYAVRTGIQQAGISLDKTNKLVLTADSMVYAVSLTVMRFSGLHYVRDIRGSINNIPSEASLSDGTAREQAVVYFPCERDANKGMVTARFNVWGIDATLPHTLVLLFWKDDKKVYLPIDITTEVQQATDSRSRNIDIVVDSLDIDIIKYTSPESSFDVGADDWDDEQTEIGL